MKKKFWLTANCVLLTAFLFAQSEKFDIASFIPPQGWQRNDANGAIAFTDSKTENGLTSFCQIILYPSTASKGNAMNDFKTAWNNMVTVPTKSKVKPTMQTTNTPDGWTIVTGSANIIVKGTTYKTIVSSISGFGKTLAVQVNTAGGDYVSVLDKFFTDLDLDSKATVTNNKQSTVSSTNQAAVNNKTVTMNDYDFIAPEQWQLQKNKDHISIQNTASGCVIKILEPQPSSGDLEKDANAVFDLMYAGWQYQKKGEQQYALSKGFLSKGLEYCMKEATMTMTDAAGRYNLEEGAALVIKAGLQIVIISVRHNSSTLAHDACYRNYKTWKRFFNSFTVKNAAVPKNTEDVSSRIIGAWSQTESQASSEYVFAANGNYAFYGALGNSYTSRDYNYEYLHIKTYSFQGDGSYSINNNQLTLKKRNGNAQQMQLRFGKVNHGGAGWKDRLCILTTDNFGENEVCYEKQNR